MRYRKIDMKMWGDEKFRRLSPLPPSGQSLFIYLLTSPFATSLPGIYKIGLGTLQDELGWSLEGIREGIREGIIRYDDKARVLLIPNAIKYNPPQSLNVIKSWGIHWDEIPECELKMASYQALEGFLEGMGEGFLYAFRESCRMPCVIQEQEQEQEQEEHSMSGKPDFVPLKNENLEIKKHAIEILNFLNEATGRNYRPVDTNLKLIIARLKSGATFKNCKAVIVRKVDAWAADEKMSAYLRPATLFNATKFEQYMGELYLGGSEDVSK